MSVTLDGFPEFLNAVKAMPDKMKKGSLGSIMKNNMKPIASAIKALAPIRAKRLGQKNVIKRRKNGDISTVSQAGNLKNSIGLRQFSRGDTVSVYAGIQSRGGKRTTGDEEKDYENALKATDGWYGFFLERGTKTIPRNPFISRAKSYTIEPARQNLETDIKNYIVKNAKKLGLDAK